MNIAMLGHPDAGKTTYMALMYERLSAGIDGFTVAAADDADDRHLKQTARAIRQGQFPLPSSRRDEYALLLRYQASPFFAFRWSDYRGAALSEHSDSREAVALAQDLEEADAIVVFVDAPDLLSKPQAARKARSLAFHVSRAVAQRDRATPLVIAWTKWDLLPTPVDDERLRHPLSSLIQAAAASSHVVGTATSIACGPDPLNIERPVLWCLGHGVESHRARLEDEYQRLMSSAAEAAGRDTLGDRISSFFKGVPTWREIARERFVEANQQRAEFELLVEPGKRLRKQLTGMSRFVEAS
jgi:hypothetical protein